MTGIYTRLEKDLKQCKNDQEKYEILRQYKREHDLKFEQANYILLTISK